MGNGNGLINAVGLLGLLTSLWSLALPAWLSATKKPGLAGELIACEVSTVNPPTPNRLLTSLVTIPFQIPIAANTSRQPQN